MAFQEAASLHDNKVGIKLNVNASGNVDQIQFWNFTTRAALVDVVVSANHTKRFTQQLPANTALSSINLPPGIGQSNKWEDLSFSLSDS
jgi:hypothetical protein